MEEFYTITINGVEETLPKMAILNRGLTKLNLSQDGVNAFNYDTLSASYEGDNLPTEDELKAKGVEQLEYETTLPTIEEVKASAKTKLISGEALTEDEANTIVL
jgi:hypothetical protein